MPKEWVHQKWRGTRPPTSLRFRTPPPQKLRKQKIYKKLYPRAHETETKDSHAVDQQRTPSTENPHYGDKRENITDKTNMSRDRSERETDQPLSPKSPTLQKQKTKKVGCPAEVAATDPQEWEAKQPDVFIKLSNHYM